MLKMIEAKKIMTEGMYILRKIIQVANQLLKRKGTQRRL